MSERRREEFNLESSGTLGLWFASLVGGLGGAGLVVYGVLAFISSWSIFWGWVSSTATVVGFDIPEAYYDRFMGAGEVAAPIVEFTLESGERLRTLGFYSDQTSEQVGEKVAIYYNPENPEEIVQNSVLYIWVRPWIVLLIGGLAFFAGLGCGSELWRRRSMR